MKMNVDRVLSAGKWLYAANKIADVGLLAYGLNHGFTEGSSYGGLRIHQEFGFMGVALYLATNVAFVIGTTAWTEHLAKKNKTDGWKYLGLLGISFANGVAIWNNLRSLGLLFFQN